MPATAPSRSTALVQRTPDNRRRRSVTHTVWIVVGLGTVLFTLALAFDPGLRLRVFESVRAVLKVLGEAQLAKTEAMSPRQDGTSEYLVVLRDAKFLDSARQFVDGHSMIEYEGESIYPRSFRIRLEVPVSNAKRALEAQPFTGMLLPVTPFLFCH